MDTTQWTTENIGEYVKEGIDSGQIVAYYQPKYSVVTEKIAGAEALVRWIDDDGSIISPGAFIPLLEDTMNVNMVDWRILECACAFQQKQIERGGALVCISVNFSRMHTYEPNFIDRLTHTVDKYGVPHDLIEAEITESSMAETGMDIVDFIHAIREAGFSVAIDDFGTGVSSLSFVKDVDANVLKIDKSLLSENCETSKEQVVLESIFSFAQRLKLTTVAEGVETEQQLSFLRTCGCDVIQGFYFAKPMSEEAYAELLQNEDSTPPEDILLTQSSSGVSQLLMDALYMAYPLIILSNLSRNSYYMLTEENFTSTSCPVTGAYDELIMHGASTMHPADQKKFIDTFDVQAQLNAYARGNRTRRILTRQIGDDGVWRWVETTNYYVKSPSSKDVLAITFSKNLPDDLPLQDPSKDA